MRFEEGLPSANMFDSTTRNLIVIDDLMVETDERVTTLLPVYLVQNLFPKNKESRTISLNSKYMVVFKNPRDASQMAHLARQMYPGRAKFVQEAFEDGTDTRDHGERVWGGGGGGGAVGAPATTSGIEADVVDTVPNTMQGKARRLMERMKRNISWTARGELIHEGVPVAGSNVVDLVNDLLGKRKTDPTGWQPFARQLRAMNLPMELVGNVAWRDYIRQATTPAMTSTPGRRQIPTTPRYGGSARRSLSWTPLARRRGQMKHSMLTPPPERQRKALASLAIWEDI